MWRESESGAPLGMGLALFFGKERCPQTRCSCLPEMPFRPGQRLQGKVSGIQDRLAHHYDLCPWVPSFPPSRPQFPQLQMTSYHPPHGLLPLAGLRATSSSSPP